MKKKCLVRVEPLKINFPDTYIGTTNRYAIQIFNDSTQQINFEFRKYSSKADEKSFLIQNSMDYVKDTYKKRSLLEFSDENFSFHPKNGSIWPKRFITVTVECTPKIIGPIGANPTLYVENFKERQTLSLHALSIPPSAKLNISGINVGSVNLGQSFEYAISIMNTGSVPCEFYVEKRDIGGISFEFEPSHAIIPIGGSTEVHILFSAGRVTMFSEVFDFKIVGATHGFPALSVLGKVIGPKCSVSVSDINFGIVPCGAITTYSFEMKNPSEIPFEYSWYFPDDGSYAEREFNIVPTGGTLRANECEKFTVELLPLNPKDLKERLVLDVENYSRNLLTIPITAEIVVPKCEVTPDSFSLGEIFVNSKYELFMKLKNSTTVSVHYEFIEPTGLASNNVKIVSNGFGREILPNSEVDFSVVLTPTKLGVINTDFNILLTGSDIIIPVHVTGVSVGPKLEYSTTKVDFGKLRVLTDQRRVIQIKNVSTIDAHLSASIDHQMFSVSPENAVIKPGETLDLSINVFLNDMGRFNTELLCDVKDLPPVILPIKAVGVGVPIVPSIDFQNIDCGPIITEQDHIVPFTITNEGLRWCSIAFTCIKQKNQEEEVEFKVIPALEELEPGVPYEFELKLSCNRSTIFESCFQCHATIEQTRVVMFQPTVTAQFQYPRLAFSPKSLNFLHAHDFEEEEKHGKGNEPNIELLPNQEKTVSIRNMASFKTIFDVICHPPFTLNKTHFEIEPESSEDLTVIFNVDTKKDFFCDIIKQKIMLDLRHSMRFGIPAVAEYQFPNLVISESLFDFGIVLRNAEKIMDFTIKNESPLTAHFHWTIDSTEGNFDVFPIRGVLEPGNIMESHVQFNARDKFSGGQAICHVDGGPDYFVELRGESENITYDISPQVIDFGANRYSQINNSTVIVTNTSDCPINYQIKMDNVTDLSIKVTPWSGTILPKEEFPINVSVKSPHPGEYKDRFIICIGDVQDTEILIKLDAQFDKIIFEESEEETDFKLVEAKFNEFIYGNQSMSSLSRSSSKLSRREKIAVPQFVENEFVVDFGKIILGDVQKKEFVIESASKIPIAGKIDASILHGTGFSITPMEFMIEPDGKAKFSVDFCTDSRELGPDEINACVPILMKDRVTSNINIRCQTVAPLLELSADSLNFEEVIVGQWRSIGVQIRNPNEIECQYDITCKSKVFTIDNLAGNIPPKSMVNVYVVFKPKDTKEYTYTFPVLISNNEKQLSISCKGVGEKLAITFDPPAIEMPPVLPYMQPAHSQVTIINNSKHHVEVISHQFDFKNYVNKRLGKNELGETLLLDQDDLLPQRFVPCVIVHGTKLSGKTTVSKQISEKLGGIPIINLKELWKDIKSDAGTDYVSAFSALISQPEYDDGFVIDGLNAFEEKDNSEFLLKAIKTKGSFEDLAKNPFKCFAHDQITQEEKSLSFVLNGLDGQNVLFVALQLSEDALEERTALLAKLEKKKKNEHHKESKQALIEMTNEEYAELSDDEKENVDKRRTASRERTIKKLLEEDQKRLEREAKEQKKKRHKSSSDKKHKSHKKKDKGENEKENEKDKDKEEKKKHEKDKADKDDKKKKGEKEKEKKKKRIVSVPTDPNTLNLITFQFTLGTMVQMVENPLETFKVCDPTSLLEKDPILVQNMSIQHKNSLLIFTECKIEDQEKIVNAFVPDPSALENAIFKKALLPTKKGITQKGILDIYKERPKHFMINDDIVLEFNHDSARKGSGRSSRKSKSRDNHEIPFLDEINLSDYTPRWKIDPFERKTINLSFSANIKGKYKSNFYFGLTSSENDVFKLPISGECIYPEIDRNPETIFGKTVPRARKSTKEAFAINTETYYFGTLVVSKEKPSKAATAPYKKQLQLTNASNFPAEVQCSIIESNNKAAWLVDINKATIPVNDSIMLTVSLYPNTTGSYTMTLLICVKDNPVPLSFNFIAEASNPQLEFSSPVVDFGKVLIKRKKTVEVSVTNKGTTVISWALKHSNQNINPFSLSPANGILEQNESENVSFSFLSAKPVTAKKQLNFDFFDEDKTKQYGTSVINLLGEAFDSSYDLIYPPKTTMLSFGVLKVNQTKTIQVSLKSRGKYPATFNIVIPSNIMQYVNCTPMSGTIQQGDKATTLSFSFTAHKCVRYGGTRAATLMITDVATNLETYRTDIMMHASTVYNSYSVDNVVDFGSVQISQPKSVVLKLTNNGVFPLNYSLSPKPLPQKSKMVKGKQVLVKQPPMPKPKMRKGQGMQLQIGPYVVCPSQGIVQPNTTMNISVELTHQQVEHLEAIALLKTADEDPQKPGTKEILIKAEVITPEIFSADYEKIFDGIHLCLRSDVKKNDINAFLEDDHTFHFAPLVLGSKQTVMARMINPTAIPITVDISIKGKGKSVSNFPWQIGSNVVDVEPNGFTEVPITFAPTTEGIFQTFFDANVRGSNNPKTKQLKFALEGFGALPTITTEKVKQISLGRVLVGSTRERSVVIRNEGFISSHVTISAKAANGFELKDEEETEYDIAPGRQQMITVIFSPQKVQRSTFEITATVEDNPKSNLTFNFVGEGFLDDVIFECDQQPTDDSDISFANTVVERKSETSFVIKNICQKDIRFSFPNHHDFTFTPKCGYVKSGQQKTISASFYSDKPVKHQSAKLPVQWAKIELPEDVNDWDDSMKTVLFDQTGQKVVQVVKEPAYKLLQPKQKDLILRVSAISDVIKYTIDTKEIEFAPTMMYQNRIYEVHMTNTSSIRLEYTWELERFTALRTDYARSRKSCFSITPSRGTIEGGASKVFKVKFAPEEVDDFKAEFKCTIPFLVQGIPPILSLTGISRRPLCHFDVKTSDYLTRRHPAYSDIPLPNDVIVIEIFSRKVGVTSFKKFDVINPTSMPYEVKWKREDDSTAIKLSNPAALISSGKRYSFSASYHPQSIKTIESLWSFSIPVHNIVRYILFVGRIVPE